MRFGAAVEHRTRKGETFLTPELALDELVVPRCEDGPAFDVPLHEIIDFLEETGRRLDPATNAYLAEAADAMVAVNPMLSRRIIENCYSDLAFLFDRDLLELQAERQVGRHYLDGWHPSRSPLHPTIRARAFPPRLVHVIAGNAPAASAFAIIWGALLKAVNLVKLPGNDLHTATAILRTMGEVDPDHPTTRSFSAAYWKGGDDSVESHLYRAQYFDKIAVWGTGPSVLSAQRYAAPGLEVVTFDPKVSVSFIGSEAFTDPGILEEVAALAATDASAFNQEGCVASRYHYVEGDDAQVNDYCERLAVHLGVDRPLADGTGPATPPEIRERVDVLRQIGEPYGTWGDYSGAGLVVRSDEPVDFHPSAKTVVVMRVASLLEATAHATVATQTVGVFPAHRKPGLRNRLASQGVQRIVDLGGAAKADHLCTGMPHDGMMPMQRLAKWVTDEGEYEGDEAEASGLQGGAGAVRRSSIILS